jgi:hypothetical protein
MIARGVVGYFHSTATALKLRWDRELREENIDPKMIVHLIDGTYELFRHFYRVKGFASRGLVGLF